MRSIVADTSMVGYTHVTGGSRVTFATGMAIVEASKKVVDGLRARAAMIGHVDVDGVNLGRRVRQAREHEGQIQGGVAQGIGWAFNAEYIYDRQGRLDNRGFLDYRVPVASDMR